MKKTVDFDFFLSPQLQQWENNRISFYSTFEQKEEESMKGEPKWDGLQTGLERI